MEANLDSLLDTMANVTGILIFMLAVTQLSMGDAMGRLRAQLGAEAAGISAEAFDAAIAETQRLEAQLAPLQAEGLEARHSAAEAQARALADEIETLASEVALAGVSPEALERRLQAAESRAADLERAVADARGETDHWSARLASVASAPVGRSARLPDPRPAPSGARRLAVLCRYGRVQVIDDRRLVTELWRGVEEALGRPRHQIATGFLPMLERIRLSSHFSRFPVGAAGLRWQLPREGELAARLEWARESLGEPAETVALAGSNFQRELRRTSARRAYLEYFVWEDSFGAYTAARRASDDAGFAAGWQAFEKNEDLFHYLGRQGSSPRFVD
ncbi:MAG: hypothetical protein AAF430_08465 [Myxococcota bacterium]